MHDINCSYRCFSTFKGSNIVNETFQFSIKNMQSPAMQLFGKQKSSLVVLGTRQLLTVIKSVKL